MYSPSFSAGDGAFDAAPATAASGPRKRPSPWGVSDADVKHETVDWKKLAKDKSARKKCTDAQCIPADKKPDELYVKVFQTKNQEGQTAGVGLLANTAKNDKTNMMNEIAKVASVSKCRQSPPLLCFASHSRVRAQVDAGVQWLHDHQL